MKLGGPDEEGCMSGPLISAKQLTRVMGFIDEGKSEGVEVVTRLLTDDSALSSPRHARDP